MSAKFSLWLLSTLLFVATAFALAKVSTMPCFQRLEVSHPSPALRHTHGGWSLHTGSHAQSGLWIWLRVCFAGQLTG
jgi:hypothetical protein